MGKQWKQCQTLSFWAPKSLQMGTAAMKLKDAYSLEENRNENGEITTENTEIQRIIRNYYPQLYANKMDNVEEIDKFLEKYNFPKLNQEEIENLNRPITSTDKYF